MSATPETPAPAPAAPSALEVAFGQFAEVWDKEDVIAEVALSLECDEALALAGLFRAAGRPDVGEQWLITHHEFTDRCPCLDRYFATRPGAQQGETATTH